MRQVKKKLLSTVLCCIREGLAATRIADFVNEQLKVLGFSTGVTGLVICMDVCGQTMLAGEGQNFQQFLRTGTIKNYSGYGQKPAAFGEANFKNAAVRTIKYDQAFYNMPYDVRKSKPNSFITIIMTSVEWEHY